MGVRAPLIIAMSPGFSIGSPAQKNSAMKAKLLSLSADLELWPPCVVSVAPFHWPLPRFFRIQNFRIADSLILMAT
jgi:hypothetical protein